MEQTLTYSTGAAFRTGRSAACAPAPATRPAADPRRRLLTSFILTSKVSRPLGGRAVVPRRLLRDSDHSSLFPSNIWPPSGSPPEVKPKHDRGVPVASTTIRGTFLGSTKAEGFKGLVKQFGNRCGITTTVGNEALTFQRPG